MSYPVLYEANATDFFNNGLGTLPDALTATVTEERNGEFVLDMTYPLHGIRANLIKNNRIVKVDAGHKLTDQRFVIKSVAPAMDTSGNTVITVHAEHVSYLANDLAIKPQVAMTDVNAEQALNMWNDNLTTPNQFIVYSDITTHNGTSWSIDKVENARQALGGVEGSILDVWGGEYRFDNLHISLMSKRGTVSNTLLAYGRNITSFNQEQNIMDTYTSVYPYYVASGEANEDSTIYTVPNLVVNSANANKFPNQKTMPLEVSSYLGDIKVGAKPADASADDKTEYITVQELQSRMTKIAQQYIKNNNIGVPKVSIKVSFVDLSKTANYADVAPLEQLDLCDEVPVRFPELDIDTTAKVSRVIWNVLTDSYDSLELGDISATLGDKISQVEQNINKTNNKIDEIHNIVQTGADGKSTVYRGPDTPTANHVGDLWYKPNGEDTDMYQWDGVTWVLVVSTKDTHEIRDKVDKAIQEMEDKEKEINANLELQKIDISQAQADIEQARQDAANSIADIRLQVAKDMADAKAQSKQALDKANTVDAKATEALTNAEQALGKAQQAITDIASGKTDITDLQAKVNGINTNLDIVSSGLDSAKDDLDKVANQAKANGESIVLVNKDVSGLKTDVADTKGDVSQVIQQAQELSTAITNAKGNISKLQQTATSLASTIKDNAGDITSLKQTATSLSSDMKDAKGNISSLQQTATGLSSTVGDLQSDLSDTNKTVTSQGTQITQNKKDITSKADKTTVDDLTKTVSNNSTSITQNAKDIKTKANSSTVDTLAGKVSDAETSISQNATDIKSKADKSTVDTLNQTVKSQGTSITQNSNAIKSKASSSDVDKLSGRVSTAETTLTQTANGLKGKADKTELDKTNNSLTTLSNNFSTTSSGFQASLSKIDDKVNSNKEETNSALQVAKADIKATADNLSTNYTKTTDEHKYVNSQIKQSADKLEASVASVSDVANAEHTNLIFNGSFKNGDNWRLGSLNTYFGVGASVPISAGTYINFSSPTAADTALAFIQNPNADVLRSITGNTVTMSIYARCQKNGGQIKVYIRTEDADGNYSYFNSSKAYDLTTAWTRYSMTAKLPTGIKAINLSFQFINIAANVVCYATGAMLNMGNVLLPYSESTLDSDAKIAKLEIDADGIKQTVSNKADTSYVNQKANQITTTIGKNKTDADNKINANKKDIDNQISQVKQTASSLSSTVANNKTATDKVINANKQSADTQFSNINQTINGVKTTVNGKADISQVSQLSNQINLVVKNNNTEHTNLILNGSFRSGDNWRGNSNVADTWYGVSSGVPIASGHYGGLHGVGNANPSMIQSATNNVILAVKGQKVTLSAYARCEKNDGQFRPYIRTTASDGSYSYFGTGSTWYDLKTGWQRYSVTGTLPSDITAMNLNLQYTNVSDGLKCYFTGAMLTLGDQLFPYQDSTNDIVSQINVDESGVLIQGKKIMIDGDATIKNAVIKSSMIDTLDASKITAGTLNAANVNIINMNANNITTGTLKGTNLSMNLNTGEVLFQKGAIKSTNGKLNISVDDGTFKSTNDSGSGVLFKDGKIFMSDNSGLLGFVDNKNSVSQYGVIERGIGAGVFDDPNTNDGIVVHGPNNGIGIYQNRTNSNLVFFDVIGNIAGNGGNFTSASGLLMYNHDVYLNGEDKKGTVYINGGTGINITDSTLNLSQPGIMIGITDKKSMGQHFPVESKIGNKLWLYGQTIYLNDARLNLKSNTWYSGSTDWYMKNYRDAYAVVHGKSFSNSSQLSLKTDIKELDTDKARNAVRNVDIREYRYKSDVESGQDKVYASAIIDDVNDKPQYNIPYDWITTDGTGRDDGTATGYLIVTVQDLYNQIDELKAEIKQLKGE